MVEGVNFIFVGTRSAGQVYAINKSDLNDVTVIVSDLDMPTGVALKDGDLYIAETDTIHIFENVEKKLLSEEVLVSKIFFDDLPRKTTCYPRRMCKKQATSVVQNRELRQTVRTTNESPKLG